MQTIKFEGEYTFANNSWITFLLNAVAIEKFILNNSTSYTMHMLRGYAGEPSGTGYQYDYDKSADVLTQGIYTFVYKNQLFEYKVDSQYKLASVSYLTSGSFIVDELKEFIKQNNFFQNKFIYLYQTRAGIFWEFRKPSSLKWENLILGEDTKEKIYDNTILHMELLGRNNGTILYGPPGTGKSFLCQALVNTALEKKYSVVLVTGAIDFIQLDDLLQILNPCLVILEDIDVFAEDRNLIKNSSLSDFLQFMSGVSERDTNINVIATTNYLERLDKAVGDRPMRFNSKFKVDYLDNNQRNAILDFYFKGNQSLTNEQKELLSHKVYKPLTASHIRAIYDKYEFIEKKNKLLNINENHSYEKAVNEILGNFISKEKEIGFGK